jgi:hypothetical protein
MSARMVAQPCPIIGADICPDTSTYMHRPCISTPASRFESWQFHRMQSGDDRAWRSARLEPRARAKAICTVIPPPLPSLCPVDSLAYRQHRFSDPLRRPIIRHDRRVHCAPSSPPCLIGPSVSAATCLSTALQWRPLPRPSVSASQRQALHRHRSTCPSNPDQAHAIGP